jgi:hypothetical protein
MFASDSDIKDIAEGSEPTSGGPSSLVSGAASSSPTDSVATLLASANTTPRKADPEVGQDADNDINANPRLVS